MQYPDEAGIPILRPNHAVRAEAKSTLKKITHEVVSLGFFAGASLLSAYTGSKVFQAVGSVDNKEADPVRLTEAVAIGVTIVSLPKIIIDQLFLYMQDPEKSRFATYIIANAGLAVAASTVGNICFPTEMDEGKIALATLTGATMVGTALAAVAENVLPRSWRP